MTNKIKKRNLSEIDMSTFYIYDYIYDLHDSLNKTEVHKRLMKTPKEFYIRSEGKTLDYISYRIYKQTNLWLLLAIYNDIIDPFNPPEIIYFIDNNDIYKILGLES